MSNRTIQVRSGESLLLSVDMEAYPKPHTFSWCFMGHELRNTTDHVITTHSHEYKWDNTHTLVFKCPSFTTWMKMFITLVQWNLTPSLCGCRLVEVLMQELLLSQLHEKCSCNSKTAQGFLVKQEQSEYKWLSQEKKPWNICSITSFLQKQILCSIIQDCMFVVNHSSSRVMVFVFHMRRTGHDI